MGSTVVTRDGTRLHVAVEGPDDAPLTVIFSHGIADRLETWQAQRAALAGSAMRRVFYDHRGFGRSERGPRRSASIDQLAADLADVIAATAADCPVVLVGHSMGGLTIQALSAYAPELFGTQVVASVLMAHPIRGDLITLDLPPRIAAQVQTRGLTAATLLARRGQRLRWLHQYVARRALAHGADHELVSELAERIGANQPRVLLGYLRAVFAANHTDTLPAVGHARTLVVLGQLDRLINPATTRLVAAAIPGAELVEISHSGHMVQLEAPDQVNTVLDNVTTTALAALSDAQSAS